MCYATYRVAFTLYGEAVHCCRAGSGRYVSEVGLKEFQCYHLAKFRYMDGLLQVMEGLFFRTHSLGIALGFSGLASNIAVIISMRANYPATSRNQGCEVAR